MTLTELITVVNAETGVTPETIRLIVKRNWPRHILFSTTQAALLVDLIEKKKAKR